ncbi:ferrochelatase [Pseudoxanthomonas sp.]|uniref:ferrochelatase n=1 Tax=Pseudoxanthomonas sp. TaxID=1871049 RepID=UPI0026371D2F|nr:ferrochelatase [Pseudoxanthomonas sp.]WDS35331.1 MAG: ferrochelatase [Pseudoxanthomonas sp.]
MPHAFSDAAVGASTHAHSPSSTAGTLLLVNLGTPEAPTASAVRRYLDEFLTDPRVVSIPGWLWKPLLRGLILPLRSPRSAEKYAKVWLDGGSPLAVYTTGLAAQVQALLPQWRVLPAMRYGEPALRALLQRLKGEGAPLRVLPLYPQYSTTTTASVQDVVDAAFPQAVSVRDYAEDPDWIAAVVASIAGWRQANGRGEHLLFSFHGLPQRVANNGDPYPQRCERSAALIAQALGLGEGDWTLTYQSRFGKERWLEPATDVELKAMAARGLRTVDVVCPGFAVDCLETLEEVGMQFAEGFAHDGGTLRYIPCLNDTADHARALVAMLERQLGSMR